MRIAFRKPDGAWHFGDSLTPFKPAGVNDIDFLPSSSVTTSECSFSLSSKDCDVKKAGYEPEEGYGFSSTITFPPPAYSAHGHSDGGYSSVWHTRSFSFLFSWLDCRCSLWTDFYFILYGYAIVGLFSALPFKLRSLWNLPSFCYKRFFVPWSHGTTDLQLFSMYYILFLHEHS